MPSAAVPTAKVNAAAQELPQTPRQPLEQPVRKGGGFV